MKVNPKIGMEPTGQLPSNWLLNMVLDRVTYAGLQMYFFPMQAVMMGDQPKFWVDTIVNSMVCQVPRR